MEVFFLPSIYLVTLIGSAVVTGLIFKGLSEPYYLLGSAALFTIFTTSQLVFRILEDAMPERLVGQLIYFLLFLGTVFLTRVIKDSLADGRKD